MALALQFSRFFPIFVFVRLFAESICIWLEVNSGFFDSEIRVKDIEFWIKKN